MSSYALLHAFGGFRFDMVRQELAFRPVLRPKRGPYRSVWSLGPAWGEVAIAGKEAALRVHGGALILRRLALLPSGRRAVAVQLDGQAVACRRAGDALAFDPPLTVSAGAQLRLCVRPA
jgi:hypothetical protein